jgi:transposase InsO family protein
VRHQGTGRRNPDRPHFKREIYPWLHADNDKVYIQTVLDCFSRYVWARLYTSKLPVTAVQILNNHALLFFEDHGLKVQTILCGPANPSFNGREYCGRKDQHPYELFLQLEEIEHRTTPVGRPQSNGYLERFHRTLLEEHLRNQGADHLVRGH